MHSRFPRRLLAAALALALTFALASVAHAAGWQQLGQLNAPGVNAGDQLTAAAPDGSTWVLWSTDDNVQIERVAADGTKGPIKDLASDFPEQMALVAESNGNALAAWVSSSGGVFVRQVEPDGTLGTAEPVGDSSANTPIALGIDGSDVATLAYTELDSTNNVYMLWAQRIQNGVPSGSPIQISTNNKENVEDLSMATNSAGDSVLAWGYSNFVDNGFPDAWARRVRRLAADGTLGAEHDLDGLQAGSADYESAVITPGGDAYIAWVQIPLAGGQQGDLKVAKLDTSDTLSSLGTLDDAADDFDAEPWLTTDSSGNLTAVWSSEDTTTFDDQLVSRRISSSGTIDPPLTSDPDALSPSFDGDWTLVELPDGKADVAWYDRESSTTTMQSAIIDPTSGPAEPETIGSTPGEVGSFSAAPDAAGDVFLAYAHTPDFNTFSVDGAFYDVQGPTIDTVAVPTTGTAGDGMVFGASAHDRSGVQGYRWDFGDGSGADGAIATHTYSAAGTYTVKLIATDAVGNTTTTTQSVNVRSGSTGGGTGGTGGSGGTSSTGSTGSAGSPGALLAQLTSLGRTLKLGSSHTLTLHLPAEPQDAFGSLTVRTTEGGVHAARLTTIGRRSFQIVHGKPVTVRVKLTARAVKLAHRLHGQLRVRIRLILTGFNGKSASHTYSLTIRTGR